MCQEHSGSSKRNTSGPQSGAHPLGSPTAQPPGPAPQDLGGGQPAWRQGDRAPQSRGQAPVVMSARTTSVLQGSGQVPELARTHVGTLGPQEYTQASTRRPQESVGGGGGLPLASCHWSNGLASPLQPSLQLANSLTLQPQAPADALLLRGARGKRLGADPWEAQVLG